MEPWTKRRNNSYPAGSRTGGRQIGSSNGCVPRRSATATPQPPSSNCPTPSNPPGVSGNRRPPPASSSSNVCSQGYGREVAVPCHRGTGSLQPAADEPAQSDERRECRSEAGMTGRSLALGLQLDGRTKRSPGGLRSTPTAGGSNAVNPRRLAAQRRSTPRRRIPDQSVPSLLLDFHLYVD